MDHILIEGVPPYDGRYQFDLDSSAFTVREWGWIKRHSSYLPLTMWDGLVGSDAELLAVFAIIALVRADKVRREDVPDVWERFADSPGVVTVKLELAAAEDDADPPSNESSNENGSTSGTDSSLSSVTLPPRQLPSGIPASVISGSPQAS